MAGVHLPGSHWLHDCDARPCDARPCDACSSCSPHDPRASDPGTSDPGTSSCPLDTRASCTCNDTCAGDSCTGLCCMHPSCIQHRGRIVRVHKQRLTRPRGNMHSEVWQIVSCCSRWWHHFLFMQQRHSHIGNLGMHLPASCCSWHLHHWLGCNTMQGRHGSRDWVKLQH